MSQISSYLSTNQLSGVGSIAEFSQGARTFVPSFNVCPIASAVDQFGRPSGYGALNTITAPGCYSPNETIDNENSLRPVLSSNPLYKNIQTGFSGNGGDTLFGARLPGRGFTFQAQYPVTVANQAKCQVPERALGFWQYPSEYVTGPYAQSGCNPGDSIDTIPSFVGGTRSNDRFEYGLNFPSENIRSL